MKIVGCILLIFIAVKGFAQDSVVTLQIPRNGYTNICLLDYASAINYYFEKRDLNYDLHSAILPIRQHYQLFDKNPNGYTRCKLLEVEPASESYGEVDSTGKFNYRASLGFSLRFQRDKWYNRTQYLGGYSSRETIDQDHPAFLPNHNRDYYIYNSIRTRTHYTPSQLLDFSFGIDNHFIGNGYRSLIQSNQNAPVPFAMMRVNFWHLEYGLIYQFNHENVPDTSAIWKFNAMHYLSYNITKRFNITLLEQVLFQPKDGAFNRGFELEYLNPIVFFRPQEYSLGSTDNVILALNTSYRLENHLIYGQFCIDEFVIDEIRNKSKWWANKYGGQLGIKGSLKTLKYVLEGNFVRPYMYSHINFGENSGNMGLAVGHPAGSNFAEILTIISKESIKFNASNSVTRRLTYSGFEVFQLKGYDLDSMSWGGDIYKSYVIRPKEYGNTIGQGLTVRNLHFGAQFSYLNFKQPIEYYAQVGMNYTWGEIKSGFTPSAVVGIRSSLFSARRLF